MGHDLMKRDIDEEVYMLQCDFKRYNGINRSIKRLREQIEEIDNKMMGMAGKGYDGVPATQGNPYSEKKNYYIDVKSRLKMRIKKELITLNLLNYYLNLMQPDERKIIEDYYIKRNTMRRVGEDNNYSKSAVEKNIKRILKKILSES